MKFRGKLVNTSQLINLISTETGKSPFMLSLHYKDEYKRWQNGIEPHVDKLDEVLLANGYELVIVRKG